MTRTSTTAQRFRPTGSRREKAAQRALRRNGPQFGDEHFWRGLERLADRIYKDFDAECVRSEAAIKAWFAHA